jgi:PTH2 family peptidyl-tRNA hydrolase
MTTDIKQVIILRKDLNMRKGKMVAQGAHASMAAILHQGEAVTIEGRRFFMIAMDSDMEDWLTGSFKKITVGCPDEESLKSLYAKAIERGLHASLILDSGLTEFGGVPTYTAVAIGPNKPELIDPLTGLLPLL